MQNEQQYEQLMLQYTQLKNGAEEIKKMIENENFDGAMSMLKSREELFLSCKCIRKYLELTPVQKKNMDELLDEIREAEMNNIRLLSKGMTEVQNELKKVQQNEKIQKAYDLNEDQTGTIVNQTE